MPDDLLFDPSQIISDDPNVVPTQNVDAVVEAGGSQMSQISGTAQFGQEETPDQSGMDTLVNAGNSPNLQADTNVAWFGGNPRGIGTEMNPIAAGSLADGVITALQNGHNWNDIQDYVNAVQPLRGGEDQLVPTTVGGPLMKLQKPSLDRLMDPTPITAEELGVGF